MTGIIILAAGASTRMQSAKQLLPFQYQNLLQHSIDTATMTGFRPVVVVLGANAESIQLAIRQNEVIIAENKDWQQGMGTSVRKGAETLTVLFPGVEEVIIMLCDQPLVTPALLLQLVATKRSSEKRIVACGYGNTKGVPVLFDKQFFPELLQLDASDGARKLLSRFAADTAVVGFPEGVLDIDTPEDYERLLQITKTAS